MFSFNKAVIGVLTEQEQDTNTTQVPEWVKTVIDKHNKLFNTNLPPENGIPAGIYPFIQDRNVAQKNMPAMQQYIHLIAFFRSLINQLPSRPPTVSAFYTQLPDADNSEQKKSAEKINTLAKKDDWKIEEYDAPTAKAYDSWLDEANKLASAALQTYNGDSILGATQKIITKRTSVWDRISRLKSPTQPFTNLIVDVFKYPEEYAAGRRKVTQDFPDIVDDLYVQNLFRVGLAAKNFFATEIARLKTSSPQTNNQNQQQAGQQPQTPAAAPTTTNTGGVTRTTAPVGSSGVATRTTYGNVNAGLNLFNTYLNSILIQEGPIGNFVQTARNWAGAQKAGMKTAVQQKDPKAFKQVRDKVYQDNTNYMNFVTGKPVQYKYVDSDNKDTGGMGATDPKEYTVGKISEMKTQEAINLINALRDIAQYTKKGVGAGARLKYANQAAGALASAAGAKLYVGS
jgi:hypothetical protein